MKKKREAARLITQWGLQIEKAKDKDAVMCEYPRPCMRREEWQCLNGLWQYAFLQEKEAPVSFTGEILVPFSPETRLSGVEKQLLPGMYLWYEKKIEFTDSVKEDFARDKNLLLHFGAVDQSCEVYVNGKKAGSHCGGYLPFTINITDMLDRTQALKEGGCTISVCVRDASDTSCHSVGKQTLTPGGMYYTATSGIWQTVWLEAVPAVYLESITWEACYDDGKIKLETKLLGEKSKAGAGTEAAENERSSNRTAAGKAVNGRKNNTEENCEIRLSFPNGEYEEKTIPAGKSVLIDLPDFISWSPEKPYLYQVTLALYKGGQLLDRVESYFAMRKCSIGTDDAGIRRIFLNNRPYMQVGVLDQGYWPESMYTPPGEEAMIYDIKAMKNLGFNMLRKHVKVEPERWYYHCDRLGMLVWQDMVNGGRKNKSFYVTYLATLFNLLGIRPGDGHRILLSRQDKAGREEYVQELKETVCRLKNHPSVVCIVPFNEGWGQFATNRITELIKQMDKSIIVDQASGWFDMGGGDLKSLHYYFFKLKYKREAVRALALTEFGGYARKIPGHTSHEKEYGYKTFSSKEDLEKGYERLLRETVLPAVKDGISATVYTQLSDVEEEINGLYTYDRKVLKMSDSLIKKWNEELCKAVDRNWEM